MPSAEAWQINMIRQMFINTADDNYISARAAYFEERDRDFWWLTMHAMEKYLKAILLMNGRSTQQYAHKLAPLIEAVGRLDKALEPPAFERPTWLGPIRIFDDANANFISALDVYGHPSSRYGTYSYVLARDDILRADHYIYWARRFARPLRQVKFDGTEIDWASELAGSPGVWRHHIDAPIERLADLPVGDTRRRGLAEANFAFFPDEQKRVTLRGGRAHNSPIYNRLRALQESAPNSEERRTERAVLEWVLKNVRLDRGDALELRTRLDANP